MAGGGRGGRPGRSGSTVSTRAYFARGDGPFDDEWTRWRPDSAWTAPGLRDDEHWDIDLVD